MCSSACRRLLLVLAAGALLAGCGDMMFYRAKSDYFPLIPGSRWTYDVGGNTAIDSVVGDSVVDGRTCVVVLRDYAPEYWTKDVAGVTQHTSLILNRGGQDFVLEQEYRPIYALPFVLGATWHSTYRDTVVVQGTDTVPVRDSIDCRVTAVDDIGTPAGTFVQCYRVETHREVEAAELSYTTDYYEWLAPGVGLVKRVAGTDSLVLTDYHTGR
ncbi:hypothetical protein JXD38_00325 [candidate division WOR-3 bacterium]|nr:hypothetical protein [candidate division WOR-3 bacterium]